MEEQKKPKEPIIVRLQPGERDRIKLAAERDGFKSASEWARHILNARAKKVLGVVSVK